LTLFTGFITAIMRGSIKAIIDSERGWSRLNRRTTFTAYVEAPWTVENGVMQAPAMLMTEGVHHGSAGPIYWAAHILRQAAPAWESTPVSLDHPVVNGQPVSINYSPEMRRKHEIGKVTKPYFDEQKKGLRATVQVPWNHLRSAEIQRTKEVSVGVFSDETYQPGTWNGESYGACSISMTPDHLALLPGGRGACSWEDGCGIRTNKERKDYQMSELLLPRAGMIVNEEVTANAEAVKTYQEWIDSGLLPPTEIHALMRKSQPNQGVSGSELLLPTGVRAEPMSRRRYKVGENPTYDRTFDAQKLKSDILSPNSFSVPDIQFQLTSKSGLLALLNELEGNQEGKFWSTSPPPSMWREAKARIKNAELAIQPIQDRFEALKQQVVNSGL